MSTQKQTRNGINRYDSIAMSLHWAIAALLVFIGGIGLTWDYFPRGTKPFWLNIHVTVGLLFFALVIARAAWRATHKPPELPADVDDLSRRLSHPLHMLMYALMVVIPAIGFVAFVWHGRVFNFGLFSLDFGVTSTRAVFHPAQNYHAYAVYTLFALIGLHAAAALWHHFVQRDGVLARMLPAPREAAPQVVEGLPTR